jgi:hypothetical protein
MSRAAATAAALAALAAAPLGATTARAEPPPLGATSAARAEPSPPPLTGALSAELFATGRQLEAGAQDGSAVELDRGEVGLALGGAGLAGEVRLETVRSAGPDSLLGVDGDSLVVRVKRAWAGGERRLGPIVVGGRGGAIAEPWVASLERDLDLRALGASLGEAAGWLAPSDLGAAVTARGWDDLVALDVAILNGEGLRLREQNDGKSLSVAARIAAPPLALAGLDHRAALHLGAREGSRGTGSARDHRLAAALTLAGPIGFAGAEVMQARGVEARAERIAAGVAGWLGGGWPGCRCGAALRADVVDLDRDRGATYHRSALAAGYLDLLDPGADRLRLWLGARADRFGDAAAPGATEALDRETYFVTLELAAARSLGGPP